MNRALQAPTDVPLRTQEYRPDQFSRGRALAATAATALGSGAVTLIAWKIFSLTSLPAFNTSMVTRALSTVGVIGTLVITSGLLFWWLRDESRANHAQAANTKLAANNASASRASASKASASKAAPDRPTRRPRWRVWLTHVVAYLSPALLTLSAIGVPLSATRLWLDGIQVDQVFRTQFLTRATDQLGYADMNYQDMPTFYPMGWFWLGGRLANAMGMPGWEVYQPWALVSLAVAGCILVPIWQRIIGSLPVATAIALTTTAITLTIGAEEPYSAVIAMGVPTVAILCARAFRGSWLSTLGVILFLGISATFYTLYTGAVSLTVVSLVAVATAFYERSWKPLVRLIVIGVCSILIAAIAWTPYLVAALRSNVPLESAAQHYLPQEGTQLPVPFLAPSVVGILALFGVIYLVVRVSSREVRTLGWALLGIYLWILASMTVTLAGSTLLGFRLEILTVLIMATAGVLAIAEARLIGFAQLYPDRFSALARGRITAALFIVLSLAGIHYAQQIPAANESAIDHAYSDTDGYGERADRYSGDASRYYAEINRFLTESGHPANQTVVMTDEKLFMAYYPYFGFNAFTAHYANPLGQFSERNAQMERWANASWDNTPQEFVTALDNSQFGSPDVMVFRGDLENPGDGFKIHLAEDIYPNQPNVRYRAIFYNPEVFEDPSLWKLEQVGPFVVAARTESGAEAGA